MKIMGMRWGYDGGGMACGPVGGTCVVEVRFETQTGEAVLVTTAVMENYEHIDVSAAPLYDKWMDDTFTADEAEEIAFEDYDFSIDDDFSDACFDRSAYRSAIRFTRYCMEQYMKTDGYPDQEAADRFIAGYIGVDPDTLQIPFVSYGCLDEDED